MKQRWHRSLMAAVLFAGVMAVPQRLAEPATPAVGVAVQSVRYERVLAPLVARAGGHDADAGRGFVVHLDAEGRPFVPEAGSLGAVPPGGGRGAGDAALEILDAPGGGKMVVLDGRFDLYSTARLGVDGRVAGACGRAGDSGSAGR